MADFAEIYRRTPIWDCDNISANSPSRIPKTPFPLPDDISGYSPLYKGVTLKNQQVNS